MVSEIAPIDLYFDDSGDWQKLPTWAAYMLSVGQHLSYCDHPTGRQVTAIAVPTRAYCAAFITLGMVIGDANASKPSSAAGHFQNLLSLPIGTPVIFRQRPRKVLKGVLKGRETCSGKIYVRVQVQSLDAHTGGGLTHLIDESRALQVQPAKHSGKLPKKQSAANKRFANSLVEKLLGEADPVQLGMRSRNMCALVGKASVLEFELRHTQLAVDATGDCPAQGTFQDVLRVDRFVSSQQSFRTMLVPVGTNMSPDNIDPEIEKGVVFDGAIGFLKWGDLWPDRNHIIVLDRTEAYFDDAINAINTRFTQNRVDAEPSLPSEYAPPGGEVLSFCEAIS